MDVYCRPLKRKYNLTSDISSLENDDDEERSRRRLEYERNNPSTSSAVTSVTTSALSSDLTGVYLQEHFKFCLNMFQNNKINTSNVWNLHIFDFMKSLMDSKRDLREMLQIAGTSLDIGAKVYSLRVDDTHERIIKLANSLASIDMNRRRNSYQEIESDNQTDSTENEYHGREVQKLKRTRKTIMKNTLNLYERVTVVNENDLNMTIKKLNMSEIVTNTSLNNFNTILPKSRTLYELLVNGRDISSKPIAIQEEIVNLSFLNEHLPQSRIWTFRFAIDQWDEENENEENDLDVLKNCSPNVREILNKSNSYSPDEPVFDERGEMVPQVDNDVFENDFQDDILLDEELRTEVHSAKDRTEFIVNMCPKESSSSTLEYTYRPVPNVYFDKMWAGPHHWKPKFLRTNTIENIDNNLIKPKKSRIRRKPEVVTMNPNLLDSDLAKLLAPSNRSNFRRIMNRQHEWTWPVNYNINIDSVMFTLCHINDYVLPAWRNCATLNQRHSQNSLEYPLGEDSADLDDEPILFDSVEDNNNEPIVSSTPKNKTDNRLDLCSPNSLHKDWVTYATKDKKFSMHRLKKVMWNEIQNSAMDNIAVNDETDEPITTLKVVYKEIPEKLPKNERENISSALAFFSLLHLANDHNLMLKNTDDLGDVHIYQHGH